MPRYPAYEANVKELKKVFGKRASKFYRNETDGSGYFYIDNRFTIRLDGVHLHYASFLDYKFGGFAIEFLPQVIEVLRFLCDLNDKSRNILSKRRNYVPEIYSKRELEAEKEWRKKHPSRKSKSWSKRKKETKKGKCRKSICRKK